MCADVILCCSKLLFLVYALLYGLVIGNNIPDAYVFYSASCVRHFTY